MDSREKKRGFVKCDSPPAVAVLLFDCAVLCCVMVRIARTVTASESHPHAVTHRVSLFLAREGKSGTGA